MPKSVACLPLTSYPGFAPDRYKLFVVFSIFTLYQVFFITVVGICRHCMYIFSNYKQTICQFFFKTISVCHTFEIIERCILTANSQGLILLTGGGPPPLARAFALLAASFFLVVPCTSCHFFLHSATVLAMRDVLTAFTL